MPQLLQLSAQKGVVECKSAIILDDAQTLAGAVGAGVQYARGVDFLRRVERRPFLFHFDGRPWLR